MLSLDKDRRSTQQDTDKLLAKGNQLAIQIGEFYKSGESKKAISLKEESLLIKEKSKRSQLKQSELEKEIENILVQIPNVPHSSVPSGNSDIDNIIIQDVKTLPKLSSEAKPHWDLTSKYGLDFELGNKITGAGFPVYVNKGARLQRALVTYFLDKNISAGYLNFCHLI